MQTSTFFKNLLVTVLFLFMLTDSQGQNVGIGTTVPKARLHVADSSVLFSAPFALPAVAGPTPITGAGTRLMWFSPKAAFRAGTVSGVEWNETNIGQYSTAFGRNTIASGQYSTSFGVGSTVSGNGGATALGSNNSVSGSIATGIGFAVNAQSYNSLVIGRYNAIAGNATSWVPGDPLFVVGNGASTAEPNNAFIIRKNGNAYFDANTTTNGNAIISGTTNMNGDANIVGTTSLFGPTNVYNTVTVKNNKEIIGEKSTGTAPLINLVPLGIVKFSAVFDRSTLDDCSSSFTNLSGNFIISSYGGCTDLTGLTSKMGITLIFDPAQAALYTEVIAAPSIFYNADGGSSTAWNSKLSATGTEVSNNDVTLKPYRFDAYMHSSDWGTFGTYRVRGTVIFYGIK